MYRDRAAQIGDKELDLLGPGWKEVCIAFAQDPLDENSVLVIATRETVKLPSTAAMHADSLGLVGRVRDGLVALDGKLLAIESEESNRFLGLRMIVTFALGRFEPPDLFREL